jgi:multicomponent Na+:H+ antiporter subunit B
LKKITLVVVALVALLLSLVSVDLPKWGDKTAPASLHVSPYYLENSLEQTHTPNVVTSVLGDYRGFDTMLETSVILIAGIAIMTVLRREKVRPGVLRVKVGLQGSLIVKTSAVLLIPIMQLYGLYVLMHGHYSPGGGFQGGVILAASLVVHSLAFGLQATREFLSERLALTLAFTGVGIYSGIGLFCYLYGKNFIDYAAIGDCFGIDAAAGRAFGTFGIELGVCLTVASVMYLIYIDLVSEGYLDEGL